MTPSRRTILKGIAALPFALPILEATRDARAAVGGGGGRPKRMIFIHSANGTVTENLLTKDCYFGRGERELGGQVDLNDSPILKPLAEFQSDLLVLAGLDFPGRAEHRPYPVMACTGNNDPKAGYDTIDQKMADVLGGSTAIKSMNLAVPVNSGALNGNGESASARGGRALPFLMTSKDAFNSMFGNFSSPGDSGPDPKIENRQKVIDFMNGRLKTLRGRVSAGDQKRIDWHLDSVAELERRLTMGGASAACELPGSGPTDPAGTSEYMLHLAAMGLACNVTNVINFGWGRNASDMIYNWVRGKWSSTDGTSTDASESAISTSHHGLSHNAGLTGPRDRRKASMITGIQNWHAGQVAKLLGELKSFDNGDGSSLLDDTTVVWFSENRDGSHSRQDIHVVVAGHGAGFRMGRFVRLADRAMTDMTGEHYDGFKGTAGANLWLSLLRAHGGSDAKFGDGATGEIPELV